MRNAAGLVIGLTLMVGATGVSAQDSAPFGPAEMRIEGKVSFRAETQLVDTVRRRLQTTVYVRAMQNTGAQLQYSGCPVTIYVYDGAERIGRPKWNARAMPHTGCVEPLLRKSLREGEELALRAGAFPAEILGDSLKPGRYYFGAMLRPNRDSVLVAAGQVDLTR